MISKDTVLLLKKAIKEYDKLVEKDYLIACTISKNHPLEFYVFRIKKENFWHLLGCERINAVLNSEDLYDAFKSGRDIKNDFSYTSTAHSCKEKYNVFMHLFNFVDHAKEIQICKTDGTPEQYQFKIVSGNYYGIIGYDNNTNGTAFPKSVQRKSISMINSNCMRISFILCKDTKESSFDYLSYCVSKKIFKTLLSELPDKYNTTFRDNPLLQPTLKLR